MSGNNNWLKFPENKPFEGQKVLVKHSFGTDTKYYEKGLFYDGETFCYFPLGVVDNPSYWMALPMVGAENS